MAAARNGRTRRRRGARLLGCAAHLVARAFHGVSLALTGLVITTILWAAALVFVDPPTTWRILSEERRLGGVARVWVPLDAMSPAALRAAIAAEDAGFCAHGGLDRAALRAVIGDLFAGERPRGGSTISQQTAKNVFLWVERSYVRKGLETWFAALIEALWPKRRILEIYLNVAEFGPGVFGVEAAAQAAFGVSARDLSAEQAARLMSVLPAPARRSPLDQGAQTAARLRRITDGAALLRVSGGARCVGA